jgi:hypothetical protein
MAVWIGSDLTTGLNGNPPNTPNRLRRGIWWISPPSRAVGEVHVAHTAFVGDLGTLAPVAWVKGALTAVHECQQRARALEKFPIVVVCLDCRKIVGALISAGQNNEQGNGNEHRILGFHWGSCHWAARLRYLAVAYLK